MKKQLPLSATSTDPVERALLGSVRRDHPGPHAMHRTAAALGLSATSLVSVTSSASASVASASVASASVNLTWLAVKAVAIGALCGTTVITVAHVVSKQQQPIASHTFSAPAHGKSPIQPAPAHREFKKDTQKPLEPLQSAKPIVPKNKPSALMSMSARRTSSVVGPSRETATDDIAAVVATGTPLPNDGATSNIRTTSKQTRSPSVSDVDGVTPSASQASSVGAQIETIDRARQALRKGDARGAIAMLDYYQSHWQAGLFAMETVVLRVEAKLLMGDRAAAERDASVIILTQPNSRYATRLRSLLGPSNSSDQEPSPSTVRGL
ncbi:MAG TPA: hypothetical protein VIV60_25940 [Polyangiaceae bacterium]